MRYTLAPVISGIPVTFTATSNEGSWSARKSRSELIGGGVAIYNAGFDHGDRTLTMTGRIDATSRSRIQSMSATGAKLTLSAAHGFYTVYLTGYTDPGGRGLVSLEFFIDEKVA